MISFESLLSLSVILGTVLFLSLLVQEFSEDYNLEISGIQKMREEEFCKNYSRLVYANSKMSANKFKINCAEKEFGDGFYVSGNEIWIN